MFGTQHGVSTVFDPALALLRVKGARTLALFREVGSNDVFYSAARKGFMQTAQNLKLTVVADLTVPFASALDDAAIENMKELVHQIQPSKPDVVVGVGLEFACHAFVRAAKLLNYTANEFLMTVCISNIRSFKAALGEDTRFVMGPVDWDRRLTGRVYTEDGSSRIHYFPHINVSLASDISIRN